MNQPPYTPLDHWEAWANKPHKMPTPPGQASITDTCFAEGWNACCDAFFGGLPAPEPLIVTITQEVLAQHKPLPVHEIVTMYDECPTSDSCMIAFARAIEAAHGIKENT